MAESVDQTRQGARLSILARLVPWAADRADGAERPSPKRLSSPYSALFDRLIPPYSFHPQTAALRPKATRLLVRVRENRSIQVSSNDAVHRAAFNQPHGDRSERRLWQ